MRLRPDPQLVAWMEQHRAASAIAASTWHELWFGCYRLVPSAKREFFETYLMNVAVTLPILPYNDRAAGWHALERARLMTLGKTPAFIDGQIAAVAVTHELALLTFNLSDYRDFNGLSLTSLTG